MSLRTKLLLSFLAVFLLVVSLLSMNSVMATRENQHMQRLLWIHHKYTTLLNLKIAVNSQLSEAQEIFIYGKEVDGSTFLATTNLVKKEVAKLVDAGVLVKDSLGHGEEADSDLKRDREQLVEIQHRYEDINRELILLARLITVGRKAKAQDHFKMEVGKRFAGFFEVIDGWIDYEAAELVEVEKGFIALSKNHNLTSLIGLSAILLIILLFFITFVYLLGPRLKELFLGTRRISEGDFSRPVNDKGKDEFADFARAMNQMMVRLAESRKKLLEQSYYSGVADMVSGVLHNVKNALAPVIIDLESMESGVARIKKGKILEAVEGLADPELPEKRRRDLLEYLQLSCASIDGQARNFHDTLKQTKTKIGLIDRVLSEHSKFSGAERPLETIRVEELVKDSLALVRKDYLDEIAVVVDPGSAKSANIKTQRIVVIQVLANLIMNALESIIRSGRQGGKVVISFRRRSAGEAEKIHIQVCDNGEGISPERLTAIFQRGVSSKQGSFGLGLHWCANAVASLNGELFAESEGSDKGACLNLII